MSRLYIQRLRDIRGEFEAARQGMVFINRNWHTYNVFHEVTAVTPNDFKRAGDYAFATYIIRLAAEFEGILKSHLAANHPSVPIPKDAKVDWLISKVSKNEGFKVEETLRANMAQVRTYRNNFAHSGTLPAATFTFDQALSWFNTFLARLPDPLT